MKLSKALHLLQWSVPVIKQYTTNQFSRPCTVVSQSHDVFRNLALEDWIFKNADLTNNEVLFLWINRPCIVVGRHQNAWLEVNHGFIEDRNIMLARRNSGGGTVYHDQGNLNCTFFTSRQKYSRKDNLHLLCDVLKQVWSLNCVVTPRDDIRINDLKVSGTASKLSREKAYHHFTVLVSTDKKALIQALTPDIIAYKSRATQSISSNIACLSDFVSEITVEQVVDGIARQFALKHSGGYPIPLLYVNPDEKHFPGLDSSFLFLNSWEWVYGSSPKFELKLAAADALCEMEIIKGRIAQLCTNSENVSAYLRALYSNACFTPEYVQHILSILRQKGLQQSSTL